MIREELWWPDECLAHEEVVEGMRISNHEHLYTFKQTRERVIWACACGRTLSRVKP